MKTHNYKAAVPFLLLAPALNCLGTISTFTTQSSWDAAVAGSPLGGESFESFSGSASSNDFGPFTITRAAEDGDFISNSNGNIFGGTPIQDGSLNLNFPDNGSGTSMEILLTFDVPVEAFAFYLGDIHDVGMAGNGPAGGITDLTVSLDGVNAWQTTGTFNGGTGSLVEQNSGELSATGNGVNQFLGFTDPEGFTSIVINVGGLNANRSPNLENFVFDNVQFVEVTPIPEPSSVLLLGFSSFGLFAFRRRKSESL